MNVVYRLSRVFLLAALAAAFAPLHAARAATIQPSKPRIAKTTTVLAIEPLKSYAIGDEPVVVAHLTTSAFAPIANQPIRVYAYKNRVAQGFTDSTGTVRIPLHFNFYPGDYQLLVAFDGSEKDGLGMSNTRTVLSIGPGAVRVETVPPIPGAQFRFLDQTLTADADGVVNLSIDHIGTYEIQVMPVPNQSDKKRISFSRWNDNDVSTYHSFKFPTHRPLQAGFLVSYPVTLKYTDKTSQLVDPQRISVTRVRSAGTFYSLDDPSSAWLPTNMILHRVGGYLESKQAIYYVDSVAIAGANVVNQGQQRYPLDPDSTWWVQVFLYPASFSARDALFGRPVGTGIMLEYPNGARQEFGFEATSSVQVESLPRGIYHATVMGAKGIVPRIPLSLSRARSFDLIVITPLDLGVLIGIPVLLALLFLVIGRSGLSEWLAARRRPARRAETPA